MLTNEQFDKWIQALESGDYKQTTKRLRKDNGFCCLGVLADTLGYEWIKKGNHYCCFDSEGISHTEIISSDIINRSYQIVLSDMNDSGYMFKDIVEFLKEHKKLYVQNSD